MPALPRRSAGPAAPPRTPPGPRGYFGSAAGEVEPLSRAVLPSGSRQVPAVRKGQAERSRPACSPGIQPLQRYTDAGPCPGTAGGGAGGHGQEPGPRRDGRWGCFCAGFSGLPPGEPEGAPRPAPAQLSCRLPATAGANPAALGTPARSGLQAGGPLPTGEGERTLESTVGIRFLKSEPGTRFH